MMMMIKQQCYFHEVIFYEGQYYVRCYFFDPENNFMMMKEKMVYYYLCTPQKYNIVSPLIKQRQQNQQQQVSEFKVNDSISQDNQIISIKKSNNPNKDEEKILDQQQWNKNKTAPTESKEEYFCKIKRGFPNLELNCYLNCSLQVIRQIFYDDDSKIIEQSQFGYQLKEMFQKMELKQNFQKTLNKLIKQDPNYLNRKGGDAYISLLNLFHQIKKDIPKQKLFKEQFYLKYNYQNMCLECKNISCKEENQIGCEVTSLKQIFSIENKQYYAQCSYCKGRQRQIQERIITNYPKYIIGFMLNKLNSNNQIESINSQENLSNIYGNKDNKYKIIGYISYSSKTFHYTFTAQYQNEWINFNDEFADFVQPKLNNAVIYILKNQKNQ